MLPTVEAYDTWYYTTTKYWPTTKTAMYYIGLGGGKVTGGRFLAPGAEENEGTYTNAGTHKNYADTQAVTEWLAEQGFVTVNKDAEGNISDVYVLTEKAYHNGTTQFMNTSKTLVFKSTGSRKSDDAIYDAVADFYATGKLTNSAYFDIYDGSTTTQTRKYVRKDATLFNNGAYLGELTNGGVYFVSQNKRGEYSLVETNPGSDAINPATGTDLAYFTRRSSTAILADDASDLRNLVGSKKYGTASNRTFKGNEVKYFIDDNSTNVYADNVHVVVSTGEFDTIEITTNDGALDTANPTYTVASGKIKTTLADGKVIDVTAANASRYMVYSNINNLTVDGYSLNGLTIATPDTYYVGGYSVAALNTVDAIDYVDYSNGAGYIEVGAAAASHYTIYANDVACYQRREPTPSAIEDVYEVVRTEAYADKAVTLGKNNTITFVDVTDAETTYAEDGVTPISFNAGAFVAAQISLPEYDLYETIGTFYVDLETLSYQWITPVQYSDLTKYDATDITTWNTNVDNGDVNGGYATAKPHLAGIYYLETPENDSEKYVFYTGEGSGFAAGAFQWNVNVTKEVIYTQDAEENALTVDAVELDKKWYPAFDTEEELVEFVTKFVGIKALEGSSTDKKSDFYAWYTAANTEVQASWYVNHENPFVTLGEPLPTSASTNLHGAKACDYTVSSTSDAVTVTAKNEIDTTVAGVYELEFEATYEGEVVDTTSIKVVVAPNYTRTWENGRVKTLTSYYVSNPTAKYAEYNYNWAAGTATVTYYTVDGAVADTATITL